MAKRGLLFVPVVALLVASGACGSDDSDKLSKAEYIAAGDQLCQRLVDESTAAMEGVDTEEELAPAIEKLITETEEVLADFDELSPPDDEAEELQAESLDSARKSLVKAREAVDALESEDPSWESLLEEADELSSASDAASKAYGFKVCGSEDE